jgi:hypothetical protein
MGKAEGFCEKSCAGKPIAWKALYNDSLEVVESRITLLDKNKTENKGEYMRKLFLALSLILALSAFRSRKNQSRSVGR